ncbi:hypothetical protein [Priestia megaterium]|uniref:hypothetical protein n=1 Tax=Priestia megaterium TaxID=1404 RepID=UPI0028777F6C|nr:hypothetical protein [Priestia megaterium]
MKVIYYGIEKKQEIHHLESWHPYYFRYSTEEKQLESKIKNPSMYVLIESEIVKKDVYIKEFEREVEYSEILNAGDFIEIKNREYEIEHTVYDSDLDTLRVYTNYVHKIDEVPKEELQAARDRLVKESKERLNELLEEKEIKAEVMKKVVHKRKWYQFWK